jgi:flagellar biosynthesis chaperone FliJ
MTIEDQQIVLLADNIEAKRARIAELESFIKVLLPSWPDGYEYLSEMSVLQMQQNTIAELEKEIRALKFCDNCHGKPKSEPQCSVCDNDE